MPPPSRRDLLRAAVAAGPLAILGATAKGAGRRLKVGLVGCGYRGSGALKQHVQAGKLLGVEIEAVATADYFRDRAERVGKAHGVPASRCFAGVGGYRRVLEAGPDVVLLAAPPVFRPVHFAACVAAGKHVFMEKPVAVDPPGCRRVVQVGEEARRKGLVVVAGTNLRHDKRRIDAHHAVAREGVLGRLYAGRAGFCIGHTFSREPIRPTTADDLVRTWQNWLPLGGDHIVEVAVHKIDLANWFVGRPPVGAVGFGGRARRRAGNVYDFFSVDLDYGESVHLHLMARQIDGCWAWVGLDLVYAKGRTDGVRELTSRKPIVPGTSPVAGDMPQVRSSLAQEQVRLLYHVARGEPLNQAKDVAESTAAAVLGREAAYTGRRLLWHDMMESPQGNPDLYHLRRKPTAGDFETGEVALPAESDVPVAGKKA